MKIAKLKDDYIEAVVNEFQNSLDNSQKDLALQIDRIVGSYFGKNLSITDKAKLINEIEQRLNAILLKSDYKASVKEYLTSFDKINAFQKELQKSVNGIDLKKVPLSEYQKAQISIVENNLLGQGISNEFSQPIKEILTRNILSGTSISDAKEVLNKYILGDENKLGVLQRYAGQTANDTLRQYDGLINSAIKEEYKMTKIIYVNSIIATSRGQCKAWVAREFLTDEELAIEIPIAVNGGTIDGYKCSGMIPETTVQNFTSFRGGFNCNHEAIPIY